MLDFLSKLLNFTDSKPIFPDRKSKQEVNDLEDVQASEISNGTSELQTEADQYNLDDLSDTSESDNSESEISESEDEEDNLELQTELQTEINDLLDTEDLSETSYATITELEGGFKNTSFTKIEQQKVLYGNKLDEIINDLNKMLNE
tara:strand:+ start:2442 stop:2882 length:441 start_codon:yes stop_codon:yes gene_type:complete